MFPSQPHGPQCDKKCSAQINSSGNPEPTRERPKQSDFNTCSRMQEMQVSRRIKWQILEKIKCIAQQIQ